MTGTLAGVVTALCLKHLHRHPLECGHLPLSVLVDLLAFARLSAGEIEE
jgi:hypothetical protein